MRPRVRAVTVLGVPGAQVRRRCGAASRCLPSLTRCRAVVCLCVSVSLCLCVSVSLRVCGCRCKRANPLARVVRDDEFGLGGGGGDVDTDSVV